MKAGKHHKAKKKMNNWDHHNFRNEYASSLSVAMLKPWPKPTWGWEGCLWLTGCTSPSSEARGRSSSRKLDAGSAAGPWRNATYWLTPHALLRLLSYATQDHLPGGGTAHSVLYHTTSVIYEENGPGDVTKGRSDGSNFSIDISFPQMSLSMSGWHNHAATATTEPTQEPDICIRKEQQPLGDIAQQRGKFLEL